MPSLEKLHRHVKGYPFDLLAINVQEKREAVLRYVRRKGFTFSILLDKDGLVSARYGIRSHPTKFLIDTSGKVIGFAAGYRNWDQDKMRSLIQSLIKPKG